MKIIDRIVIWLDVTKSFVNTFWGIKANIVSSRETVEIILNEKKSLIRFGDGEFGIYRGKNIHYQSWSEQLKREFIEIKKDYEKQKEKSNFLLAVPKRFMSVPSWRLIKKRVYVSSWSQSRYDYKKEWNHSIRYGDSFLFEKKNKEIYGRLWNNNGTPKNILFIHNDKKFSELFAVTYNKKVEFIKCPMQNAYEKIDFLENEVFKIIKKRNWDKNDVMVVVSAGPAGKILVYRLCKKNIWGIDTGHCWDDPLEGM